MKPYAVQQIGIGHRVQFEISNFELGNQLPAVFCPLSSDLLLHALCFLLPGFYLLTPNSYNFVLCTNFESFSPDISRIACCDHGYDCPSGRPRVSDPATYCSSTSRIQSPAVARWHSHLHGLATAIRKTSGLEDNI